MVAKPQTKAAATPTNKLAPQRWTLAAHRFGGHGKQEAGPASLTARGATLDPSWNFGKIPVFPPSRTNRPHTILPPVADGNGRVMVEQHNSARTFSWGDVGTVDPETEAQTVTST